MVGWAASEAEVWRKASHPQQMQECSRHVDARRTMETKVREEGCGLHTKASDWLKDALARRRLQVSSLPFCHVQIRLYVSGSQAHQLLTISSWAAYLICPGSAFSCMQ